MKSRRSGLNQEPLRRLFNDNPRSLEWTWLVENFKRRVILEFFSQEGIHQGPLDRPIKPPGQGLDLNRKRHTLRIDYPTAYALMNSAPGKRHAKRHRLN